VLVAVLLFRPQSTFSTNLVFLLVRRFGISDYVFSGRMIDELERILKGSDRGFSWRSPGACLACVRKNTGNHKSGWRICRLELADADVHMTAFVAGATWRADTGWAKLCVDNSAL